MTTVEIRSCVAAGFAEKAEPANADAG